MKIIKQGSLILLLAAFSFFSSAISAALNENPNPNWVEAKQSNVPKFRCKVYGGQWWESKDIKTCTDARAKSVLNESSSYYDVSCFLDSSASKIGDAPGISCSWKAKCSAPVGQTCSDSVITNKPKGQIWNYGETTGLICPPEGFPEHVDGPRQESATNPSHMVCFKPSKFKNCPLGFYAYAVSPGTGKPEECVPINCPAKGTAVNNIKNLNNVIPNGASGTYCDGLCNYSIEAGGIGYQGQTFASGVSMGSQCGQSPVKGQKFTPLDKEKNCTEYNLTGANATYLECNEGTIDEPVPDDSNPPPDSKDAEVEPVPVIDPFTGVECTTVPEQNPISCVGKNITAAIHNQTENQTKLAAERHNKLVKQQADISLYVEEQQRKREQSRKTDAVTMVEAIQEVTRTIQNSGGIGGGTGGGTTGGTDEGVKGAIEGLSEGINGTDVETDSTPSDGIASFYDPEYPNGFQDVWSKNKSLFDNSEMNQYLDSWKLSASGNPPIMNACFNMGFIDFGCNEFTIDPRIFPFLRIIMLVSAAFLCRALIFGG